MRSLTFVLSLALAACGGTSNASVFPGDDAGSAADGAPGDASASALASGTCAFVAAGALDGSRSGPAYATMNGAGNLVISCGEFAGAAGEALELDVGNGDYRGPGRYALDEAASSGSVVYSAAGVRYRPDGVSSGCAVDITLAPPTDDAPSGARITGTFTCHALAARGGRTLDLSAGRFDAPVR